MQKIDGMSSIPILRAALEVVPADLALRAKAK